MKQIFWINIILLLFCYSCTSTRKITIMYREAPANILTLKPIIVRTINNNANHAKSILLNELRRNGYEIEFHNRKPMVYHQSLAWGVNYSLPSYLDGTVAHAVFRLLPKDRRRTHGMKLLKSALALNAYNFLLVDAAQDTAATPQEQILFWKSFLAALKPVAGKPGCPAEGLYNTTVKNRMFARIARLPIPKDKESVRSILSFLEKEKCSDAKTLAAYRRALKAS